MKQRSVMAVVLLSIFTLGIYDLFWLASTKKVLNEQTDVHTPSLWVLFAPILLGIAALVALIAVSASNTTTSLDGTTHTSSSGATLAILAVYVVAFLVIIPISFYWFFKFSKAVDRYTHGQMSTAITFILLVLLRFIGIAVIQDKFNDMANGVGVGMGQPQFAGAPAPGGQTFGQVAAAPAAVPQSPVPGVVAPVPPVPQEPTAPIAPQPLQPSQPPQPPVDTFQPPSAPAA